MTRITPKKKPQISIIVPAYNEEQTIAHTLQSLVDQTYPNREIIVVNNNSTDNTAKIAKTFSVRLISEKKQGYHNAVNTGVKRAHGPIITMCDADSIYPPDWLQKVMHEFDRDQQLVAVYGSVKFHDHNFFVNLFSQVGFTFFIRLSKILGFDNTAGFNFAMKKSAYHAVGGYNPKIYDHILTDIELGKRLQKIGKLKQNPHITVYTSSRRFKEDGLLKTTLYFLDAWYRLHMGKEQKMSYTQYNTYRNKKLTEKTMLSWLHAVRTILHKGKQELRTQTNYVQQQGEKSRAIAVRRINTAIQFTEGNILHLTQKIESNLKTITQTLSNQNDQSPDKFDNHKKSIHK